MPFASDPVYVGSGDQIQLRYPTPSTWNTTVTVNVKIGTGSDPDGVTFSTKVPDAVPDSFAVAPQQGYASEWAGTTSGSTPTGLGTLLSTFLPSNTYYSPLINLDGFEIPLKASISATSEGPKTAAGGEANNTAQFRVWRNGSFATTWISSLDASLTDMSSGVQPGDKIQLKCTVPAAYATFQSVTFTVTDDGMTGKTWVTDPPQSSATWNFTSRAQDQTISSFQFTDVVDSLPSGEQDESGTSGPDYYYFSKTIAERPISSSSSNGIDFDAVLRCTTTSNIDVLKDINGSVDESNVGSQSGWTKDTDSTVVAGDTLWFRIANGGTWTTKTTGTVTVFGEPDTSYSRSGTTYYNIPNGSYGSGLYAVTQTSGTLSRNWQVWTEVDRYPDDITASPIYTYGIKFKIVEFGGGGYSLNTVYDTETISGGGSGLEIQLTAGGAVNDRPSYVDAGYTYSDDEGAKDNIFVVDAGYGYNIGDQLWVNGNTTGTANRAKLEVLEYQRVYATGLNNTSAIAESGFMYYADMNISGLGTEYANNSYSDLNSGATNLGRTPALTNTYANQLAASSYTNGQGVTTPRAVTIIASVIAGITGAKIRKNNTGTWVNSLTVGNGDLLNLKMPADFNYSQVKSATVELLGPPTAPDGYNLPTNMAGSGGKSPSYTNRQTSITLTTRNPRRLPYPFHVSPVFRAEPLEIVKREVEIDGLDPGQSILVETTPGGNTSGTGGVSKIEDGAYGAALTYNTGDKLFVKLEASSTSSALRTYGYRFRNTSTGEIVNDSFYVFTKQYDETIGEAPFKEYYGNDGAYIDVEIPGFAQGEVYITLAGAGGGNGGCDAPNSEGGFGGSGNVLKVKCSFTDDDWPDEFLGVPQRFLRIYPATAGEDGTNFASGGAGGAGGWGYAEGGNGGNAGIGTVSEPNDRSGGGGGGGGATAVTIRPAGGGAGFGTLIAFAGGGGGAGGAGNDTLPASDNQHGNFDGHGSLNPNGSGSGTINLSYAGDDGQNNPGAGGGAGGGGGGYSGNAGTVVPSPDSLTNTDLDGLAGFGGGAYYNADYAELVQPYNGALSGRGGAPGQNGIIIFEYDNQDIDPILLGSYSAKTGDINDIVYSDEVVQVTDITGTITVDVTSENGFFEAGICVPDNPSDPLTTFTCDPASYGSSINVTNNQYVGAKVTTGTKYAFPYNGTFNFGPKSLGWTVTTGEAPITLPGPLVFTNVDDRPTNTVIYSNIQYITQVNVPIDIVLGGDSSTEVSINGGPWTGFSTIGEVVGQAAPTESIQLRVTSSSAFETPVTSTIKAGSGDTVSWTVETEKEGLNFPDPIYTFQPKPNRGLEEKVISNSIEILGIDEPIDFIVDNDPLEDAPEVSATAQVARVYKNLVLQDTEPDGTTSITVVEGDRIYLEYTTTDVIGEQRYFRTRAGLATSTLGYYETDWLVGTAGTFGETPTKFNFQTVYVAAGQYGQSVEEITISGLANNLDVAVNTFAGLQVQIKNSVSDPWPSTWQESPAPSTGLTVENGNVLRVRLLASSFPGVPKSGAISVGNYSTSFTVQALANVQDPIEGQWYSSIQPVGYQPKSDGTSVLNPITMGDYATYDQVRRNTKYDGLPVGSMIPVFQDGTEDDGWGNINGDTTSRFPGWVYCNGQSYDTEQYPLLFAVIGTTYGAEQVTPEQLNFNVPDMRNRYIKGTGPIDGTQLSSPALAPQYLPNKAPGSVGFDQPGATGGMWFVDTVGDPGTGELEQVETPAEGEPPLESQFFGIATIQTTGYNDVTGIIDFKTSGECGLDVQLKELKLYDMASHTHNVIIGQADIGDTKPFIFWGQEGGWKGAFDVQSAVGNVSGSSGPYQGSRSGIINMWGYPVAPTKVTVPATDYLPASAACSSKGASEWYAGDSSVTPWVEETSESSDSGYLGVNTVAGRSSQEFNVGSLAPYLPTINKYIDIEFAGHGGYGQQAVDGSSKELWKHFGAFDIPRRQTFFKQYKPAEGIKHGHYLSTSAFPNISTDDGGLGQLYAFGNVSGGGTANTALETHVANLGSAGIPVGETVELLFNHDADIGMVVLPGTFTLSASKQLIPEAAFAPQDKVAVMSPYTWAKWMIKAY